jgi:hypothetical protein
MWSDDIEYTVHYKDYKFAPVTHEIANLAKAADKLAPILAGMTPAHAQVAVLHSTTTGLAVAGDYAPTADQTTIIDLLYRSQTPCRFVSADMIRRGDLDQFRVLVAVGAVALPDDVLESIRSYAVEGGGHVIANVRFARIDEDGRPRAQHPPVWMGAQVEDSYRRPRQKTGAVRLARQARAVDDAPIDVNVPLDTWSSRPISLDDGTVLGSGNLFGHEDTQLPWSCGGRHEMFWEALDVLGPATVVGRFEDDAPAVVETAQTLYIVRDTCWVDGNFELFFLDFLARSGVVNANAVVVAQTGAPATGVNLRMWEKEGRRLLFVVRAPPTLHDDGEPTDVEVTFDAYGEVSDALRSGGREPVAHLPARRAAAARGRRSEDPARRTVPARLATGESAIRQTAGPTRARGQARLRPRPCFRPGPRS